MCKKNLLPLTVVLLVSSFANATVDYVKVGYFNSMEVLGTSQAGKQASTEIDQKRLEFTNNFKKSEEAYTNKVKDLQTKASTLSVSAREKAEAEVLKAKRELENQAKEYEEELKLVANQTQQRLFRDLSDSVYEVGRAEGHDVMVDVMSGRHYTINPDKVDCSTKIVSAMDKKGGANNNSDKKTT